MKVLLTVEYYYPYVGGAERVAQSIAEGLVARGVDVTVATSAVDGQPMRHNGAAILPFRISGNRVVGIREGSTGEIRRYIDLLRSGDYDVLMQYAAQTWHVDIALRILDDIPAKKILLPCGFSGLTTRLRRILYWRYFRDMAVHLARYDKVVYSSDGYIDRKFADRHGLKNSYTIPNGIDTGEFDRRVPSFRAAVQIPAEKKIVLNVSNHYRLKGHRRLIRAFEDARRDDTVLVIIGNQHGNSRSSCYDWCRTRVRAGPVVLLESLPRELVVSAYKEADVFVLASEIECFPLVIIEAMYAGTPIVSTDVGCVNEFCVCTLCSNGRDLADGIRKALEDGVGDAVDKNRRMVVERLNWSAILDEYESVIRQ